MVVGFAIGTAGRRLVFQSRVVAILANRIIAIGWSGGIVAVIIVIVIMIVFSKNLVILDRPN